LSGAGEGFPAASRVRHCGGRRVRRALRQGHILALFAEIGDKIQGDVALADLVEHIGGAPAPVVCPRRAYS
jgi:hypothetical protein